MKEEEEKEETRRAEKEEERERVESQTERKRNGRGKQLPHCTFVGVILPLSIRDSPCVLCRGRRITRNHPF